MKLGSILIFDHGIMTLRCAEALTYRNYFYMITIANFVTKFNRTNNVLRYLNLSNWQHMTTKVNIWLSQIEIICKRELYKEWNFVLLFTDPIGCHHTYKYIKNRFQFFMYLLVCIFCICLYVIKKYPYKQIRRRAQKEHIVLLCTDPIGCWMCYFATNNKNIKIIANHSTI